MKKQIWKGILAVCLAVSIISMMAAEKEDRVYAAVSVSDNSSGSVSQNSPERVTDHTSWSKADSSTPADNKTSEDKKQEEEIDAYFDQTVFVGDSIMLGFRNYAMKRQDTFLSRPDFLAAGSYSANNALWPADEKSVHPVYKGKQRQVWESISMMKSKRVFIMLGMNDLNINGLEGTCEKYRELIGEIEESNPEAEIHIMSMTYVLNGKVAGMLKNETIREFNMMLEQMAEENGWGYVEIAEALADEDGDLSEVYCSDEFAHQNPEAYDVWVSVLRDYAQAQLNREAEASAQTGKTTKETGTKE